LRAEVIESSGELITISILWLFVQRSILHSKLVIMQIKGELFGLILNSKLSTSSTSIMVNSVVLAKHRIMDR